MNTGTTVVRCSWVLLAGLAGGACGSGSDDGSKVAGSARVLNGATPGSSSSKPVESGAREGPVAGPVAADGDWVVSPNQVRARL